MGCCVLFLENAFNSDLGLEAMVNFLVGKVGNHVNACGLLRMMCFERLGGRWWCTGDWLVDQIE